MMKVASIWSRLGDLASLVATPLLPSHYLALVHPLAGRHTLRARVEAVHAEAPDVRTLVLRPGRGWRGHRAGQHLPVSVVIDGRIATRMYSISSSPERRDGRLSITVKAHPGGRVSHALVHATPIGTFLTIGQARGDLVCEQARGAGPTARPLFLTAGSGITPIASMLRTFALRGAVPDSVHVHVTRRGDEMIFGDELRTLALDHPRYRLHVIESARGRPRFTAAWLDAHVPDWRTREAWACAPQAMLDDLAAAFADAGRGEALHVERFRAALAAPAQAHEGTVRFVASTSSVHAGSAHSDERTTTARSDGRTPLLRLAEDAGLSPPHGCRMGICHACDTPLRAGCVRDLRTGTTIDEPGTPIQLCVCAAVGDVELALQGEP